VLKAGVGLWSACGVFDTSDLQISCLWSSLIRDVRGRKGQTAGTDTIFMSTFVNRIGFIFPPLRALAVAGVCHIYLEFIPNQFLWLDYLALLYISSNLPFCRFLRSVCVFRQSLL